MLLKILQKPYPKPTFPPKLYTPLEYCVTSSLLIILPVLNLNKHIGVSDNEPPKEMLIRSFIL